ncbi:hypothetical protein GCM10023160_28420 [Brachybacterium paraconglomeratum]|uniref:hypothetical protein n=1 Tax=Brachybacterium paraconglomeratum TaxID=173362 RepID=UPI0031F0C5D2
MSARSTLPRPSVARFAGALFAVTLLAAGCGESSPGPEQPSASSSDTSASSDGGGAEAGGSDAGGASDGGGQTAAGVPQDPYPVTPAPEGFAPPEACSGEGAYFGKVGSTATPELPERAGETLTIDVVGIEGEDAQLTATLGDGSAREVEAVTLGETVTIDLWTISVTSVCGDTQQVEFDLIN